MGPPRLPALVAALALLAGLTSVAPSTAHAATGTGACASHLVPATRFGDTRDSSHRAAIDCAAWWGLVNGRTTTRFDPTDGVTRGQTAAMLARLLAGTGRAPDDVPSAGFPDTAGHVFEDAIDLLAHLGIARGAAGGTFGPNEPVTRGQMASLLVRTFADGYEDPLPRGTASFTDVPATYVHRDAIERLTSANIAAGTTATTFAPSQPVARAQMASFTTRSAGVLLARGHATRPTARPGANDAYASRMRGAWVHLFDDTLKTRAGIRRMLDDLVAADANVVVAQVARRHDSYYTSAVLPRTTDPRLAADLDVLATLIELARPRGIEVHAWYGVAPTYHGVYDNLPRPAGWMHTTHGLAAPETQRWVTRDRDGRWTSYLDPGVPAVRSHVAAVVRELATNYDLDGIHLDYVRYENATYGYNPRALTAYRSETGATGTPSASDPAWTAWRRDQTQRIVRAARDAVAASGNDVTLSAAVITWGAGPATADRAGFRGSLPYTRTLQDWDRWVREGDLDAVIPMNYFRGHESEARRWFDGWQTYQRALAAGTDVQVVAGPGGYLNRAPEVHRQVTQAMRGDGAMLYSYQQPVDGTVGTLWRDLARTRWHYAPTR